MAITPLASPQPLDLRSADRAPAASTSDASAFGRAIDKLVNTVEMNGTEANAAVSRMMDGSGEVHDAMIALQRAELSFQLTVQVRNKLVQAYQEIMRMPV